MFAKGRQMEDETNHIELDYVVVVNQEEQYSIWPSGRDLPLGWTSLGEPASKSDCLSRIETLWTDMRPKSLRLRLEGI